EYRGNVPKLQALLRALNVLWQRQQEGRVLKPAKLRRTLLDAHVNQWDEYRDLLVELQLVQRTDVGSYVLTRNLRTLSVAELAAMTPWPIDTLFQVEAAPHAPAWEKYLGQRSSIAKTELQNTLGISVEGLFAEEFES